MQPQTPYTFTPKLCTKQILTLTEIIKSFEHFLTNWEDLPNHLNQKIHQKHIVKYIYHSLTIDNKYYHKLDDSDAYTIMQSELNIYFDLLPHCIFINSLQPSHADEMDQYLLEQQL